MLQYSKLILKLEDHNSNNTFNYIIVLQKLIIKINLLEYIHIHNHGLLVCASEKNKQI